MSIEQPSDPSSAGGIAARLFDADGRDRKTDLGAAAVRSLEEHQLLWVDVDRSDPATVETVADRLGLDPRDAARLTTDDGRAGSWIGEDRLHLTLEALETDDDVAGTLRLREIDLVAGPNLLVTAHTGPVESLAAFVASLDGQTRIGALTSAELLSSLVDEVIAGYFRLVEELEREIDDLDHLALRASRRDDVLGRIVALRRRIGFIRRTLAPHREVLSALVRPEGQIEDALGRPWPGLMDRLEGCLDSVEALRDSLLGTYDIYMGRVAQRANEVMKVLTLVSAVFLPSVVLAGVMGMNFQVDFFDDPSNFFVVVTAMGVLAALLLGVARWRQWI